MCVVVLGLNKWKKNADAMKAAMEAMEAEEDKEEQTGRSEAEEKSRDKTKSA